MVDNVKSILESKEVKDENTIDPAERARLVRERRDLETRRRLDELRAHAAAAQAQKEARDIERRRRAEELRYKDDERRQQVEERRRAMSEAAEARRDALARRERERAERVERARASRSHSGPRVCYAFGSSTPRMLEPVDTTGLFWAHRSENPFLEPMTFVDTLASSTSNVMLITAPLTRRSSFYDIDRADGNEREKKDENGDIQAHAMTWSSVARRRTDLVPTIPAPRPPGRAYSMTRLDRIHHEPKRTLHSNSPSMMNLNRNSKECRSGDTTPGSRPGSAMSNSTTVIRRQNATQRRPRPASIAGTGLHTPKAGTVSSSEAVSAESTPSVSRTATTVTHRSSSSNTRRQRPTSLHVDNTPPPPQHRVTTPAEAKPPIQRKPKISKENTPRASSIASSKESSVDKEVKSVKEKQTENGQVNANEVTQKLEALQLDQQKEIVNIKPAIAPKPQIRKPVEPPPPVPKAEEIASLMEENVDSIKTISESETSMETVKSIEVVSHENSEKIDKPTVIAQDKMEESEMTSSMIARNRITTEEEAKAALAERRRRAREELEKQARLEKERAAREAEEEEQRQREEEERERQMEEEARQLAQLQRQMEEEKLRKAIEAQQQLEREEAARAAVLEAERIARAREEEEERKAKEAAEQQRKLDLQREEEERRARRMRVEAIMSRTRQKKIEEDKKQEEENKKAEQNATNKKTESDTTTEANSQADTETSNQIPNVQQISQEQTNGNNNVDLLSNIDNAFVNQSVDLLGSVQNEKTTFDLINTQNEENIEIIKQEPRSKDSNVDLLMQNLCDLSIDKSNEDGKSIESINENVDLLGENKLNGDSKTYETQNGHSDKSNNILNGAQIHFTLQNGV